MCIFLPLHALQLRTEFPMAFPDMCISMATVSKNPNNVHHCTKPQIKVYSNVLERIRIDFEGRSCPLRVPTRAKSRFLSCILDFYKQKPRQFACFIPAQNGIDGTWSRITRQPADFRDLTSSGVAGLRPSSPVARKSICVPCFRTKRDRRDLNPQPLP